MKRVSTGLLPSIALEGTGPIYQQLADWFRRAIAEGRLRPGQRVPSTRALAGELGVSRLPVLGAYEQLHAEGYLESFTGAGTNDVLTLSGITYRGGSFAADDLTKGVNLREDWETVNLGNGTGFTLTDNLVLSASTVNIDTSSTLFAGAGVHPVIRDVSGSPVTVNNAGTIDLTNGDSGPTDTLTIEVFPTDGATAPVVNSTGGEGASGAVALPPALLAISSTL